MKTLKIKDTFVGETHKVAIYVDTYVNNDNLYVGLLCKEGKYYEPYCDITVNLDDKLPENCAYVDTNNNDDIIEWLISNKLGKPTGRYGASGFCTYPEFEFDMNELKKYIVEAQ